VLSGWVALGEYVLENGACKRARPLRKVSNVTEAWFERLTAAEDRSAASQSSWPREALINTTSDSFGRLAV
jgi:hypothetical protein